jgi:signal transduction histidine kinase/HPt (histidine-containing phosphotransfer) domain-containing protein
MKTFNQAKILIVDDNIAQVGPLIDLFSQHKAIPLIAQSGEDALELIQENCPDLILMDIILPQGMNGYQTCQKIKSNPSYKDIPIIFTSSLKSISDKINAFESGGVDYIEKPLDSKEVLIRVNTHLKIKLLQDLLKQTNKDLKEAKEQADLANYSKSTFLANMSHEIRTPMNSIIIANDLLASTHLTKDQAEYLDIMKTSSSHLLGIINDILDLSQIESGKLQLNIENFDLFNLLNDIEKMFLHQIKNKGLNFTCLRSDKVIQYVQGDSDRIRQILINLIGNAIKFTKSGEIKVIVQQEQGDSNEKFIKFEVHDTGIGISKDRLDYIFNDFIQAENFIRKQFGGTGLGLSICKKLVHLMNGSINAYSEESKGSIFSFTIPLKPGQRVTEIRKDTVDNMFNLKILLVDDVSINRKSAGLLLQKMGHQVMDAINGLDAIEILKQNNFDLIFMDLEMPEVDGMETTRLIRNGQAGQDAQNTPVIAMTAHAMSDIKKDCLAAGMNDYISKPISKVALTVLFNKLDYVKNNHELPVSSDHTSQSVNSQDLDFNALVDAFNGDHESAKEIISEAKIDFNQYVEELHNAFESKNFDKLRIASHTIKGMTANICAFLSSKLSKDLEAAAKQKDLVSINDAYQLFTAQAPRLKKEIEEVLKNQYEF